MRIFRVDFKAMGGPAELQLAATGEPEATAWARAAIAEVQRIEAKYSRYREDSWIGRLNAAAGGAPVQADEETLRLLGVADDLHRRSGGRFDATSGALRSVWRFDQAQLPDDAALRQALARVGWARVQREGSHVRLPEPGMALDFGGFGKEYAVDRACEMLLRARAGHALVNLAGDCRAIGPRPDGQPWQVGIAHPRHPGQLLAWLPLADAALATSGDYERGFWLEGRRYSHVLDALTGWPVQGWCSVSVRADSALAAGSLSTLALLAGEGAKAMLDASACDYLAVDASGAVHQPGG